MRKIPISWILVFALALVILVILFKESIVSMLSNEVYREDIHLNDEVVYISSNTKIDEGQVLDLSGQSLTKAPDNIFNQKNLRELNLSNNNLEGSLQAEIRHLKKLMVLNLSNNQFTGLPAEVGQLSELRILDLSNNQFTGLPYELGNLKNLERLDLRGNDYSKQDLEVIKQGFVKDVVILVDGE